MVRICWSVKCDMPGIHDVKKANKFFVRENKKFFGYVYMYVCMYILLLLVVVVVVVVVVVLQTAVELK